VLTVRTAHAGCVLTRGASGDCITRPANAGAHPRCSATTRGANMVSPGGLQSGHHPSKHMAPHATGALHAHTQLCNAPVCGTGARRRRAAGNTTPPQKQHTRWQFASMRATRARPRKRRGRARRPRRVADASPLPVEPCTNARSSAAGTRTGRAILDGPRMSTTTTSARRVCVPADARARGQTTAHSHAQQLRVRSGQRTHRVWLCAITRKKTARARRGRNAHMHVAGRLPPCAPVWNDGTNARSARHPPQKQHTRWQPSSMRASRPRPARRLRRRARRPRRVAGASPLPVDTQMHSEQRRAKRSGYGNAFPLRWPPLGRKCNLESFSLRFLFERNRFPGDMAKNFFNLKFFCTKGSSFLVFQLYAVMSIVAVCPCQSQSGKYETFCFNISAPLEQSRIETLVGCALSVGHI
jgi:hypothetical protein